MCFVNHFYAFLDMVTNAIYSPYQGIIERRETISSAMQWFPDYIDEISTATTT
ncbi:hypothetical protein XBKQ1_380008 [Xenorhabdus bovienii str. kraussei Quebec]|uniref:Uncharacterized protein n=1 Tax=Xenorhabdus bovienii str. kraussei Quebec TaxID=1398203 RepID=A0A077PNE4_XENBV|nr:hypothetical protein XBKQ1_380008 [Xenorhabdus bovienii str. kraussei Quebec]